MYESFEAIADEYGNTIPVTLSSDRGQPAMRIDCPDLDEYIYITKEQAMAFFGLVERDQHSERGYMFINPPKE